MAWTGFTRSGNVTRFVAPTLGVRRAFVDSARAARYVPFGAVRVGPYFTRSTAYGSSTVLGANATVGVEVARVATLSARYDAVPGRAKAVSNLSLRVMVGVPVSRGPVTRAKMRDDVPAPGRLVDVDGHRMHLVCLGSGSPTVVFDSGLSDSWLSWIKVQPAVARQTRACSYDRAGIGYSDPGPTPRTSDRIADELHALLSAGGVDGPYVLVGHSFGGLNMRLFASRYPEQVAGLVLVDASHPDQVERLPAELQALSSRASETYLQLATRAEHGERLPPVVENLPIAVASRTAWYRALYEELRSFDESATQVRNSTRPLDVPVVVISAGRHSQRGIRGRTAAQFERAWAELQSDMVRLSPQGSQRIAVRSRHYVQRDEPHVVIEAILAIVRGCVDHRPRVSSPRLS